MKLNLTMLLILFTNISIAQQICRTEAEIPSSTPDSQFINNIDGTVSDRRTGLMWQRCALGYGGVKCNVHSIKPLYTWQQALDLAYSNNFAGYNDWRLPNLSELESIGEVRCISPAINLRFFPNTPSAGFWSATPHAISNSSSSDYSWLVHFAAGRAHYGGGFFRTKPLHVRLVRSIDR